MADALTTVQAARAAEGLLPLNDSCLRELVKAPLMLKF